MVSEGDTLASIARQYRISVADLAAANELGDGSSIDGMEALVVPQPNRAQSSGDGVYYRVRRGDTLITIADRFGVTLSDLRSWNHLRGNAIVAGHRLRVAAPGVTSESSSTRRSSESASTRRSKTRAGDPPKSAAARKGHSTSYRVRRGDTLGEIAARFGVSTAQLRRWNHIRGNLIHAGAVLLVSAPVGH